MPPTPARWRSLLPVLRSARSGLLLLLVLDELAAQPLVLACSSSLVNSAPRLNRARNSSAARTGWSPSRRSYRPLSARRPRPSRRARHPRWIARRDLAERQHRVHRPRCGSPAAACRRSPPSPPTRRSRCPPAALHRRHALASVVAHARQHHGRAGPRPSASPPTRTGDRPRARTCRPAGSRQSRVTDRGRAPIRARGGGRPARPGRARARASRRPAPRAPTARVSRSSRSAKPRVKPSGMCCAITNAHGGALGEGAEDLHQRRRPAGRRADHDDARRAPRRHSRRRDDRTAARAMRSRTFSMRSSRIACTLRSSSCSIDDELGVGARRRLRDEVERAELERLEHVLARRCGR